MIAKLTGVLDSQGPDWAIVDVGGVGYLVHGSTRTLSQLPGAGEAVRLHIETVVREDAITLYGFADVAERDMFRLLTSVQGVGARVGLAILSVLAPDALKMAIAAQDKGAVAQASGVGPKLAQRVVNELKDKVAGLALGAAASTAGGAASAPAGGAGDSSVMDDAVSALVNLQYRPADAMAAVAKARVALGEDADLSALVPAALKELSPS